VLELVIGKIRAAFRLTLTAEYSSYSGTHRLATDRHTDQRQLRQR